jgi:predicted ester cyclase
MQADLTYNTIVFKKSFDEKDGSERRSTARGVNTADVMTIKSSPYIDSRTKVPGTRYMARIDRENLDANGQKYTTSAYFIIPVSSLSVTADITDVITTFKALVADAAFIASVLNNEK